MMKPTTSLRADRIRGWLREERGSFTLESTFVFPILLTLIMSFLLLGIYFYQKVILFYSASVTAERAAFSWDNSHREARSGMLPTAAYDGLYRRLGADSALGSLFGLPARDSHFELELPQQSSQNAGSDASLKLAQRKLISSVEWITAAEKNYAGRVALESGGLFRYIEVKLKKPLELLPWERTGTKEPAAVSNAYIVDPVEFIRSVDLIRYYTDKLANAVSGYDAARERAGEVLSGYEVKP